MRREGFISTISLSIPLLGTGNLKPPRILQLTSYVDDTLEVDNFPSASLSLLLLWTKTRQLSGMQHIQVPWDVSWRRGVDGQPCEELWLQETVRNVIHLLILVKNLLRLFQIRKNITFYHSIYHLPFKQ